MGVAIGDSELEMSWLTFYSIKEVIFLIYKEKKYYTKYFDQIVLWSLLLVKYLYLLSSGN